jgi:diaminopimelate epimerase
MNTIFYKLQGTGNDFVAFDFRETGYPIENLKSKATLLCDRRFGIGADGLLALLPSGIPDTAYEMIYLNADGSEAGMCGNGGRCIARLASELGVPNNHRFHVHGKPYSVSVTRADVTLSFPAIVHLNRIPDIQLGTIEILHTGTEHICIKMSDSNTLEELDYLRQIGQKLRFDQRFAPKGTNVNFYYPIDHESIKLVTYERGVEDLTLSCGTGSLAAAICHGHTTNQNRVRVFNRGGVVLCAFNSSEQPLTYKDLTLKGPAELVFQGSFDL